MIFRVILDDVFNGFRFGEHLSFRLCLLEDFVRQAGGHRDFLPLGSHALDNDLPNKARHINRRGRFVFVWFIHSSIIC